MGGSSLGRKLVDFFTLILSPAFAGLKSVVLLTLGLAPQALCLHLLRRLSRIFVQSRASKSDK